MRKGSAYNPLSKAVVVDGSWWQLVVKDILT